MSLAYDKLGEERKQLQAQGNMPLWFSTGGWQLFKERYLYQAAHPRDQYQRIAHTLACHTPDPGSWSQRFFDILWKGWLSPSTPVLANTGTTRGLPVSCAGTYISDSIDSIYKAKHEVATLTKHGFGTASYLGDIRPRGTQISVGGEAEGVLPIIQGIHGDMAYVSQGNARRGSWAGYLPITHGDFDEVCTYLEQNPDGNNVGWNISAEFVADLNKRDPEALRRYAKVLKTKMITGKGYLWFDEKANARAPKCYKDRGLKIRSSQLCSEIALTSDDDHTFTCVLASLNASLYDEWKDSDLPYVATVFLDCVAQEFIERAKNIHGLEKAVLFTKKSRALGLGLCGYHTYLQKKRIPFESLEATFWNAEVFREMDKQSKAASTWLASVYGEPEWMKGYGMANTHRIAVAPTKSTALIMGGISEGINPDTAMVYTQRTPAGEIDRVNPVLLEIMKERGVYTKEIVRSIRIDHMGSVQKMDWLTDEEKLVFKTAFEIDQRTVVRNASVRSPYIDQWQSLNLFFSANEDVGYINEVHKQAFEDPNIVGLYYVYSKAGIQASRDECLACQ